MFELHSMQYRVVNEQRDYNSIIHHTQTENMASIYLNNIAAYLISNPERCGNPISHLHKALLNLQQFPNNSSQAILARRKVETDSDGELPPLS